MPARKYNQPPKPHYAPPAFRPVDGVPSGYSETGNAVRVSEGTPSADSGFIPDPSAPPVKLSRGLRTKWGGEALQLAERGISSQMPASTLARMLATRYKISRRTGYRVVALARTRITGRMAEPLSVHKAKSLALYASCLQSPTSTWREKLFAQKAIDALLGLEKAKRIEVNVAGKPGHVGETEDRTAMKAVDHERFEKLFLEIVGGGNGKPAEVTVKEVTADHGYPVKQVDCVEVEAQDDPHAEELPAGSADTHDDGVGDGQDRED